ncbi:MAG: glycosyltransferase, partial [Chloroflexia bacterium]|nr:glycosyltransferase [Chloroflexia bacterium]
MEEPLLSICIPTYNRADLLEYCLEGLREFERYDVPFEVVVSDNASEDRTLEVLHAHSAKMPYLKTVRMDTTGTIDENVVNVYRN